MLHNTDTKGLALYRKYENLKTSRHNWQTHWDEISTYVMPKKDNIYGYQVVGEKKTNRLYDTYAINSLENMTSGLHGMLTNPSTVWFGLGSGDNDLDQKDNVQKYLQKCVEIMTNNMNQSNFQTEIYEVFLDLGSFGTSVLRVEEDADDNIRFTALPIYQCVVAENQRGVIDSVFSEYDMTVENIVKEFGDKVPKEVHDKAKTDPSQKMKILHVVQPSENAKISGGSIVNQPFASTHILSDTKTILKEKGFNENPHIVPRWSKVSGEIYGRSPAMKCLPEIKMVNKMKKATIEAAQLAVAPPIQAPDDGVVLPLDLRPRGINFFRAGNQKDRIEKIDIGGDVNLGEALIKQVHDTIDRAFFIDKLQIREADRMTATEIVQRRDEQLRTLGPILGRQHHELLKPLVERVFSILERKGLMPEVPEELGDAALQVQFVSQIAKAQRSAEGDSITKALQLIMPMAELVPDIMDNIDTDEMARLASNIHGMPHEILRDSKDRDQMRAERAKQQQEQAEQEKNLNEAEVVNKLGGAAE